MNRQTAIEISNEVKRKEAEIKQQEPKLDFEKWSPIIDKKIKEKAQKGENSAGVIISTGNDVGSNQLIIDFYKNERGFDIKYSKELYCGYCNMLDCDKHYGYLISW